MSVVVSALLTFTPITVHIRLDCGAYLPVDVHPAGNTGFYLGRICPDCLYVEEVLGILVSRHLAEAVRWFLDAMADVPPPLDQ